LTFKVILQTRGIAAVDGLDPVRLAAAICRWLALDRIAANARP
jgi:hypothetical protein